MKIQFVKDTELQIVENYDEETDTTVDSSEIFFKGTIEEVDVFGEYEDTIDIQFGDGSCAYAVDCSNFTVIEE